MTAVEEVPEVDEEFPLPCMRTLTIKILAKCWTQEYQDIRSQVEEVLLHTDTSLDARILKELVRCSARQKVASTLLISEARLRNTELFIPMMSLRCQRELGSCQEQLSFYDANDEYCDKGTEKDFILASLNAWVIVQDTISKDL